MENSWILPRKEYGGFVRITAPRRTPLPALRKRLSALQLVKKGFDKLKSAEFSAGYVPRCRLGRLSPRSPGSAQTHLQPIG